jgi:UPF0716 family protein affecting phage T7 exclusion
VASTFLTISIVPYLIFLFLIWRIYRRNPQILGKTTMFGFFFMLVFIFVTAVAGAIALRVIGARTLGSVDWLHGIAEAMLTVTNGLIALGLKKQLDQLELQEIGEVE